MLVTNFQKLKGNIDHFKLLISIGAFLQTQTDFHQDFQQLLAELNKPDTPVLAQDA